MVTIKTITYVVSGALQHRDSMGNSTVILPGEVQKMSAGTGVLHSEFNPSQSESTHLLQIWIHPNKKGIPPSYSQKSFREAIDSSDLVLVISPDEEGASLPISQDARIYVSKLSRGKKLDYKISKERALWIQVVKGALKFNDQILETGDGLSATDEDLLKFSAVDDSEFLIFDLKNNA